ncbi:unnamed protein product, partial [Closterium sp. NIES-54]
MDPYWEWDDCDTGLVLVKQESDAASAAATAAAASAAPSGGEQGDVAGRAIVMEWTPATLAAVPAAGAFAEASGAASLVAGGFCRPALTPLITPPKAATAAAASHRPPSPLTSGGCREFSATSAAGSAPSHYGAGSGGPSPSGSGPSLAGSAPSPRGSGPSPAVSTAASHAEAEAGAVLCPSETVRRQGAVPKTHSLKLSRRSSTAATAAPAAVTPAATAAAAAAAATAVATAAGPGMGATEIAATPDHPLSFFRCSASAGVVLDRPSSAGSMMARPATTGGVLDCPPPSPPSVSAFFSQCSAPQLSPHATHAAAAPPATAAATATATAAAAAAATATATATVAAARTCKRGLDTTTDHDSGSSPGTTGRRSGGGAGSSGRQSGRQRGSSGGVSGRQRYQWLPVDLPDDGYDWCKYGQKPLVVDSCCIRSYYRCFLGDPRQVSLHPDREPCPAKKIVDWRITPAVVSSAISYASTSGRLESGSVAEADQPSAAGCTTLLPSANSTPTGADTAAAATEVAPTAPISPIINYLNEHNHEAPNPPHSRLPISQRLHIPLRRLPASVTGLLIPGNATQGLDMAQELPLTENAPVGDRVQEKEARVSDGCGGNHVTVKSEGVIMGGSTMGAGA